MPMLPIGAPHPIGTPMVRPGPLVDRERPPDVKDRDGGLKSWVRGFFERFGRPPTEEEVSKQIDYSGPLGWGGGSRGGGGGRQSWGHWESYRSEEDKAQTAMIAALNESYKKLPVNADENEQQMPKRLGPLGGDIVRVLDNLQRRMR